MFFLRSVEEAQERLSELIQRFGDDSLSSVAIMDGSEPVAAIIPWKEYCEMLQVLEVLAQCERIHEETDNACSCLEMDPIVLE